MTKRNHNAISWPIVKLGEVVAIDNVGLTPQRGTVYRYIGLEQIEQQTGRIIETLETDGRDLLSLKYNFSPMHVLYGKLRPNLNKVALPTFSGICGTDILPLVAKSNVLREYIAYYLRSEDFVHYAVQNATGTKMPRFGRRQFLSAQIPLPPLPVQERIVLILQKADDIRRKRKEALEVADAIAPSAFISMFGDPQENPNQFRVLSLGDLAEIKSGVAKGRKFNGRNTIRIPYLRVANVQDGFLDLSEIKDIEVLPEDREKFHLEDGDVLMTEGGDPDKLGRGCVWRNEIEDCIHQNHVFRVRTDRSALSPEYLAALLRTQYAKHYFLSSAKRSSNLASVNLTQVKAFPVPAPPVITQQKFVSAVGQWRQSEARLLAGLKEAESIFQCLLSQAFTGKLTVEWETTNAEEVATRAAWHRRLPRLVLLALLAERAKQQGRQQASATALVTALMKYAFLLQMEGSTRWRFYHFIPYHYGPFTKEVYDDLKKLEQEGLLAVEGDRDEDKTKITVTDIAHAEQALADVPDELREDAAAVIERYGHLNHNSLLQLVYKMYPAYAKRSRLRNAKGFNGQQKLPV